MTHRKPPPPNGRDPGLTEFPRRTLKSIVHHRAHHITSHPRISKHTRRKPTDATDQHHPTTMSKQSNSSKYNINAVSFIPGKAASTSTAPSSSFTPQQNMSSHSAPPPNNPKSRPGANTKKSTQKPRESRAHNTHRPVDEHDDEFYLNLEDEMALGGNFPRARRGQISINHLLEFSLPSRETNNKGYNQTQTRRRRRSSNNDRIHLAGQEFVNANYRFVVDYRFDYRGQVLDPNLLLDKSQILRVIVPKGHHCPICLTEDIIAPRMISCGHIFCHSCLLSFLDSEPLQKKKENQFYNPKRLKECPLCSESVKPEETLPVLVNETDERFDIPQIGHDVVLKLMARPMENILPIPHVLNLNHRKIGNTPWYSDTEVYPYARIMKGGLKFIVDSYERDKAAILKQYEEDKLLFNDDGKYVNKAIFEIDSVLDTVKKSFGDNYKEPNPLMTSMDSLSISKNDSGLDDSNCYFFYQTAFYSSTRYFLSPLDVKVLLRTYGSYADFPTTLLLKVDNVSHGYMVTETTLKRYKYMAHLPLGTEFAFIEVNWKNMLPPEIYKLFSKELSDRRRRLLAKMKREDRDKKTYDNEQELKTKEFYTQENQGWGSYEFLSSQDNFGESASQLSQSQLHPLGDEELAGHDEESETRQSGGLETTVWGTKIPKSQLAYDTVNDEDDDPFNTEELLKFALSKDQDETSGGKKKKKGRKRLVLASSGQSRGYR